MSASDLKAHREQTSGKPARPGVRFQKNKPGIVTEICLPGDNEDNHHNTFRPKFLRMPSSSCAYSFDDKRPSITINRFDLPAPWINYLSNGKLHALVSQASGGFLWWKHPSNCRLTRYRMHHLPIDSPGFYIYIRHRDGSVWSPTFRPVETPLDSWSAIHEPGVTEFLARKGTIEARFRLFIPPDHNVLVWDLELTNLSKIDNLVDVFAFVELSQHNWQDEMCFGYYWRHMLKTWYDPHTGALLYLFHNPKPENAANVPGVYFACSQPIRSYSGDRDAFVGSYRDERNPQAVENGKCGNESIRSGEPCAALHTTAFCKSGKTTSVRFLLGAEEGMLTDRNGTLERIRHTIDRMKSDRTAGAQLQKLRRRWKESIGVFRCTIPNKNAQRQINIWSPVNCIHVSRYERTVNALAPGIRRIAVRDSCQDMLAMTYRDAGVAERVFLDVLTLQERAGNARPNELTQPRKCPDVDVNCDHHLWLPLLAHSYLAETGNLKFLETPVPYYSCGEDSGTSSATVWDHLLAGIRYTQGHLGRHGLPLTLKGDWNDIIGKFSREGKGESVFAAQQLVVALNCLIAIAMHAGKQSDALWLTELRNRQIDAIRACAWNGKWWYRCFDDDGNPVGGEHSEFGKIWLNSQTWAVISNVGTERQNRMAMNAVHQYLQTDVGLMKLYPGFKTWPDTKDPFSGYNPGNGENGAIFCHSNTWAIIAEALLGNAERAWKYFDQLVPHNALQKMGIERYKGEPYAWVSNIVGLENPKFGWANVNHITGTAAWMDVAATQYLLGIRPTLAGLCIDPCIPRWKRFRVERTCRGCRLLIDIENPQRVSKGVRSIACGGIEREGGLIPHELFAGKSEMQIKVVMG